MNEQHVDALDLVIGAPDAIAVRRAEHHLAGCARCAAEVARLTAVTGDIAAAADPVPPPPELRSRVLADIRQTPQQPVRQRAEHAVTDTYGTRGSSTSQADAARRRRAHIRRLTVAAAAAVVLAVGVAAVVRPWERDATPVTAVQRVESAPDATRTAVPVEGGTLVVIASASRQQVVATLHDVSAAPQGKTYQAWFITADGPIDAGLLRPGTTTLLKGTARGATAAAVTLEPVGGSTRPTSTPLAKADL